jgi:hypothetical protein
MPIAHVKCSRCGGRCSQDLLVSELPILIRAFVECPECIEKHEPVKDAAVEVADAAQALLMGGYDGPCIGPDIEPLMTAVIAYDAAKAALAGAQGSAEEE